MLCSCFSRNMFSLALLHWIVPPSFGVIRRDSSPAEISSPSQPPPGGHQSQTKALMGVTIAMLSFSTIFVSLRFLVWIHVLKSVWWDDWTIFFALVRFMRSLCFNAKFELVRDGSGRRIGHCRIPLWLRSPSILHRWPSLWQDRILFIRRVDPDFCDLEVDQDIHLLLSKSYSSNKGLANAFVHCYYWALFNLILTLSWILQCIPVQATWDLAFSGKCFTKSQPLEIILVQGSKLPLLRCNSKLTR